MDKTVERVAAYIKEHNLIPEGCKRVIVALSGGADSVALLLVLRDLGFSLLAAHCNYHLRGDESNRDAESVKALCNRLGVDLEVRDFTVEPKGGESVEMACRRLRYDWFEQLRQNGQGSVIAVAHNMNDNVETLLLNLLRGTGIAGMRAMLPRNASGIIRPMLEVSRAEIEEYLASKGQSYVVDSTNLTNLYRRNCLRNDVLPRIAEHFPDYLQRITGSIDNLRADWCLLEQLCADVIGKYILDSGDFDLQRLATEQPRAAEILYRAISGYGFSRAQSHDMVSASQSSGKRFVSSEGIEASIDRGILSIAHEYNVEIVQTFVSPSDVNKNHTPYVAYFDADVLGDDYCFRPWQPGDKMQPLGMCGRSKKVSDIFNDAKISCGVKSAIRVMVSGDKVLWVPGARRSIHCLVTPETCRVLRVEQILTFAR